MKALYLSACFIFSVTGTLKAHPGDTWVRKQFHSKLGSRAYRVFIPDSVKPRSSLSPLVVMLHGCLQNSDEFAAGTQMNEVARRERFAVIYPEQRTAANQLGCWNWFKPEHQKREMGEAGLLAALVQQFVSENPNIDRSRVYVAGLSAGGAMTSILSFCYPDVFAAAAIHSGVGYKFAESAGEASEAMKSGTQHDPKATAKQAEACFTGRQKVVPTIVIHGTGDDVASPTNAEQIVNQLLLVAGLDQDNLIIRKKEGLGGAVRKKEGYRYGYEDFGGAGKNEVLARRVSIEMLGHAWSGGNGIYKFNDAKTPKSSELIWDFFRLF